MSSISVKESEQSPEIVQLPLKQDRLTVITLERSFPGACGLMYRINGQLKAVGFDEIRPDCVTSRDPVVSEPFFEEPIDGWTGNIFFTIKQSTSRPTSPYHQTQDLMKYVPIEVDDLVRRLENYLFFEEVDDVKNCFTVMSTHYAITYNHKSHKDWVSSPSEKQTRVTICNQAGQKFETKVVECDAEVDFVVVHSEVPLVSKPPIIGIPHKLERYILLGYPDCDSNYQALEGVFSSIERDDEGRIRGSSGSRRGYSGGPIFNYKGELLGINVANESPAKFVGFNSQSTIIDFINEMNASFPFLSVIVPSYYLASKYHKDCKFRG